jgi:hypothetical protein
LIHSFKQLNEEMPLDAKGQEDPLFLWVTVKNGACGVCEFKTKGKSSSALENLCDSMKSGSTNALRGCAKRECSGATDTSQA